MTLDKLIQKFKATFLDDTVEVELDNGDWAILTYDAKGEVVVKPEKGAEFSPTFLSQREREQFAYYV